MSVRLLVVGLCLVFAALSISPAAAAPTNVLFINVDDMNCDSVGAFGCNVKAITPHIDQLASEGMRFERAFVTIAICQPTRAVWMTGRYPQQNGALGFDPISKNVPTLVESLHEAGYLTGLFAKNRHVVPTRSDAFDVNIAAAELKNGRDPESYYRLSASFFDKAKSADKPFFLVACIQDPHRPFAGGRSKKKDVAAPISRTIKANEIEVPGFLPDLPDVRKELAQYYTSVHRADKSTGAILKALAESGLEKNTLVMFMSDHGMPLPFAKTNCYYHSNRTPWIVRWPGKTEPGSVDQNHMISGIDFAPTILDALGLKPLPGAVGRSFQPVLLGKKQADRDRVFLQINRTAGRKEYPMDSIVTPRFGYIFNAWSNGKTVFKNESQAGYTMAAMKGAAATDDAIAARVKHFLYRIKEELYDYENDPDALHNLVDDPDFADELQSLRKEMLAHLKATNDPEEKAFVEYLKKNQE